jgi:hypothetical protein
MPLYQIVDCSFKADGSGRAYGYKIPHDWEPKIGQKLKVEDAREGGFKFVYIVKLDGKEIPNVPYKWGLELVDAEAPAESNVQKVHTIMNPAPNETPNDPDFGGALIGKALAADLASPDPVALRQNEAKPFVPAPPHPGTPDPFAADEW